jgi:hypothetical protein
VLYPVTKTFNTPLDGVAVPEFVTKLSATALAAVIVIELEACVIVIPVPAVNVAAAGDPAVEPIINWPSVANAVSAGIPVVPVVKTALLAVARPATVFAELEYRS